jgi:hypothetical protein
MKHNKQKRRNEIDILSYDDLLSKSERECFEKKVKKLFAKLIILVLIWLVSVIFSCILFLSLIIWMFEILK